MNMLKLKKLKISSHSQSFVKILNISMQLIFKFLFFYCFIVLFFLGTSSRIGRQVKRLLTANNC
jgi:hypothetical protein